MQRFRALGAVVAVVLGAVSVPASAASGDCRAIRADDPLTTVNEQVDVCRHDTWIKDGAKLGNASATGAVPAPTWTETAPASSFQAGGGSMFVSPRTADTGPLAPAAKPTLQGSYTGTLDNLAATLYLTAPQYSVLPGQYPFNLRLTVDGVVLYEQMSEAVRVETMTVTDEPPVLATRFAFTNLYAAMEANDLDLSTDAVHDVQLLVRGHFSDSGNIIFHADSTEYPAGLIFNLEPTSTNRLKGYTEIRAS